ncbi:hypothetical protein CPAR01_01876 [Colletotrichum paranaense]|uniref:Uncharacterized protein n=1 Tax=Colletotrichum paranaense TaxID=1914294 RepID=A0ABQ9SYN5_9PEZI|nr:uncharacterized protein CPAR01_01876 [Colletotrichum paranaense]KAK1544374.1 hypothetical protein CPAR01_01876 [Colletotrichum paranaense]
MPPQNPLILPNPLILSRNNTPLLVQLPPQPPILLLHAIIFPLPRTHNPPQLLNPLRYPVAQPMSKVMVMPMPQPRRQFSLDLLQLMPQPLHLLQILPRVPARAVDSPPQTGVVLAQELVLRLRGNKQGREAAALNVRGSEVAFQGVVFAGEGVVCFAELALAV